MINVSIRQVCLFLSWLTGHQNPVIKELSFGAQYPPQNETDLQKSVRQEINKNLKKQKNRGNETEEVNIQNQKEKKEMEKL